MSAINTKPLAVLQTKPLNPMRVMLLAFLGTVLFFGGLVLFVTLGIGLLWAIIVGIGSGCILVPLLQKHFAAEQKAIERFAKVNNFSTLTEAKMSALLPPSALARKPVSNIAYSRGYAFTMQDHTVSVFECRYTYASSGQETSSRFSIAVLSSDKELPHIYLDGKQNFQNNAYKKWHKIALEGNFNDAFDLYTPENTHLDALTFLTPDVMQQLMDTARVYDIESFGNNIYLITAHTSLYYPTNMERLIKCLQALVKEI